ncbi:MAG TPA: aspartate aminotransferase family protein [Chthoniobacterales bacterium]
MLPEIVTSIPGPRSQDLAAALSKYENRNVTNVARDFPVFWERATGANVWDVDGNRFLDLTAGFAVAAHGHTHPSIRAAITAQSEKLMHAMGDVHPAENKFRLCQKLSQITFERWGLGTGKTTLCNSGFEAVEVAIKTSLLHSGNPGVLCFRGGYHGLGYGALEVIGIPWFREPFVRQLRDFATSIPYPNCYRCPFGRSEGYRLEGSRFPNCASSCLAAIEDQIVQAIRNRPIGCILVEPCQGRGGEIVPPLDFLRMLRRICDTYKILLVFDEIYTGLNRTGTLFASDQFGVYPDILCLGKGLTSGFPLAACVGRAEIMDAWPRSSGEALHTTTFLGNPMGCAAALASIELHLEKDAGKRVRALGKQLRDRLVEMALPAIGHVRGLGLMIGAEIVKPDRSPNPALAFQVVVSALKAGLLILGGGPEGNVLSFTPPFCIEPEEIDFACAQIYEYLRLGSVS